MGVLKGQIDRWQNVGVMVYLFILLQAAQKTFELCCTFYEQINLDKIKICFQNFLSVINIH